MRGIAVMLCCAWGFPLGASGASAEPTFTPWEKMHMDARDPSIATAVADCRKRLPRVQCDTLRNGLVAWQQGTYSSICRAADAPDGLLFKWLTGAGGEFSRFKVKRLGRTDPAVQCVLGDGVIVYWFNRTDDDCNNLGLLYVPPPPPAAEQTEVCRPNNSYAVYDGVELQGYFCETCYVSGLSTKPYVDGSVGETCDFQ